MNYEEQFFKQMVFKGNKSCSGFTLLITLSVALVAGVYFITKFIVKGVQKMLLEREDKNIQREVHRRAVAKFFRLLGTTNFTLQWNVIKSHTNRSTGELTQYVNFVAYNGDTCTVEIINTLVNEVLYGTLDIVVNKDLDINGTILLHNADILKIQEDLQNVTGSHINFRNF